MSDRLKYGFIRTLCGSANWKYYFTEWASSVVKEIPPATKLVGFFVQHIQVVCLPQAIRLSLGAERCVHAVIQGGAGQLFLLEIDFTLPCRTIADGSRDGID